VQDDVRFHASDELGALHPLRAEVDAAFARGHAEGLEQAREETLDAWRTMLVALVENTFGELDEGRLDQVAAADFATVQRWMRFALKATSVEDVFAA
jgi:hypothetical protein